MAAAALLERFLEYCELGRRMVCLGWDCASNSAILSRRVIPSVCFKFSSVRFVSAFYLLSRSFKMFLLR